MGLFSRFTFNQQGSTLHSSGITGNDSNIGAASTQSFEQRQQTERSRQLVGSYRDAGVLHNYRKSAQEELTSSRQPSEPANSGNGHQQNRATSRIDNRPTSRMDVVTSSRSSAVAARPSAAAVQPRPAFREPQARRYDPYS